MTKAIEQQVFKEKWNDTFDFSIEDRSKINSSTLEARIFLTPEEANHAKGDKYFKVSGEKVLHYIVLIINCSSFLSQLLTRTE
jgi:hypothetical protein